MPSATNDCNLLFGVLAVQMDFIGRDALVAAMNAWVLKKKTPLGHILVEYKALSQETCSLLEALARKHLELHDNDAQKSPAAVRSAAPSGMC